MKYLIVCSLCSGLMGLVANVGAEQSVVNTGQSGLRLSAMEKNAMSKSSEGLYDEAIPAGGVMVNLQGRFQSAIFASVNEAGEVTISHSMPVKTINIDHAIQGE